MTNALVEAGLVLASVCLGLFDVKYSFVAWTIGASLGGWVFVHETRLRTMWQTSKPKLIGSALVAVLLICSVHLIAFGFGFMFNSILAPK
jgi:hypothetical protein